MENKVPFNEYPRPQFKRDSFFNLNGEWDYAINNSAKKPKKYDGKILVPYSPETSASGVNRQVGPEDFLHYRRTFTLPSGFVKNRIILNVGACDQVCWVYINGYEVCSHKGGYNAFGADVTEYVKKGENEIYILVTDNASSPIYGRGKQAYKRGGIWYTASSGIWQTIWLESAPRSYVKKIKITPNYDEKTLEIAYKTVGDGKFIARIKDGKTTLAKGVGKDGVVVIDASQCKSWSVDEPNLYDLRITYADDEIFSYFGMRKFSIKEAGGKKYFTLNDKPIFHSGLLDQGYWPNGLYTPPSYEEMVNELKYVKQAGFNMIRKHIKVEPMRWYYECDKLGILVWQDMINGGEQYSPLRLMAGPFINMRLDDKNYKKMGRGEESRKQFMYEAKEMIAQLYNCVSLCLWTPFNECWGQFNAVEVCEELRKFDKTRYFDHASGWQDKGAGDLCSKHIYFRKARMKNDGKRVLALTEFGGYSYQKEGHVFSNKEFGYRLFKSEEKLRLAFERLYEEEILPAIRNDGLCATVYTQLTDVEDETNGILTYDRVKKIPVETLIKINEQVKKVFEQTQEASRD